MNLLPTSDPSLDSPETTSRFSVWLIPLLLLFFAAALVIGFVYLRSHEEQIPEPILLTDQALSPTGTVSQSSTFIPEETIDISESFSGQLYFNTDFGSTHLSSLIIEAIDKAEVQIEVAVYSMDHPLIRDALYRAANRGVAVKLLLSEKRKITHDLVFYNPPHNISRVDVGSESTFGSMHHKFLMIDRNFPSAKLFFGSYNFTALQEKFDPSFVLETTRPEIIEVFGTEFTRLYTGGALADRNPFAALLRYPEGYVEIWFSPPPPTSVGLRERFIGLIADAKKIIEVMIWNLTDNLVAQAFVEKSREGVPITILTDDSNYSLVDSVFSWLNSEKELYDLDTLQVFTDHQRNQEIREVYGEEDLNSFLHHHLLLVDNSIAVFGTNNWSTNGFFHNNESIMISTIPYIVSSFEQAFGANLDKTK